MTLADEDLMSGPVVPKSYVTVTSGMRGFFAVLRVWVDEDDDGNKLPAGHGFYDVWSSGIGSYKKPEDAAREARDWATAEGLEYRP